MANIKPLFHRDFVISAVVIATLCLLTGHLAAQPKLTTTTTASDKFGKGGTLETTSDEKLHVLKEVWKDASGKIRETHTIAYDGNVIVGEGWYFKASWITIARQNGQWEVVRNGQSTGMVPSKDALEKTINDLENKAGAGTSVESPTTVPAKETEPGKVEPNPKSATNMIPASEPKVIPGNVPGFSTYVTTPTGLNTIVITGPGQDVLEIYLPRTVAQGETFTGSMKMKTSDKHAASGSEFTRYSLKIGDRVIPLHDGMFTVKLGPDSLNHLRLFDNQGRPLTGVDFMATPATTPPTSLSIPGSSTSGQLFEITGPCTGTTGAGDFVKIGGKDMPVIAASNGHVVVRNDYDQGGLTEIQTQICGVNVKKPFRVLTLQLSAESLNLLKGQSTTVHIIVGGLEKLQAPAHMAIIVSGAVTMTGAREVEIQPAEVSASGAYTTTRTLHAVETGGFGVNVTVIVDKEP